MTRAYILCKNEQENIERAVRSLQDCGLQPVVLDSGSTDRTPEIVSALGAELRPWDYRNHCSTYNRLTAGSSADELNMVIDADMVVSPALHQEAVAAAAEPLEVVQAPVRMVWFGHPVPRASMYPPKPFLFRGGREYFEPVGHGERLVDGLQVAMVRELLVHDDRKPYLSYLASQVRYGNNLARRGSGGKVNWRDWLRLRTPIGLLATPLVSYLLRRGFLDGRGGTLYALDKLIAEAIFYRQVLVAEAESPEPSSSDEGDVTSSTNSS